MYHKDRGIERERNRGVDREGMIIILPNDSVCVGDISPVSTRACDISMNMLRREKRERESERDQSETGTEREARKFKIEGSENDLIKKRIECGLERLALVVV